MKRGNLVRLRNNPDVFYDWGTIPPRRECGFFLRNPENMNLLNEKFSGRTVDFSNLDVCIILEVINNHLLVLNPRYQSGLIHMDKVEVIE